MRRLIDTFGLLIAAAGGFLALGGYLISETIGAPPEWYKSTMLWLGLLLILIGYSIGRASGQKTCPQCAEKVKVAALKCKHCGYEFAAPSISPVAIPETHPESEARSQAEQAKET